MESSLRNRFHRSYYSRKKRGSARLPTPQVVVKELIDFTIIRTEVDMDTVS